MSIGYCGALLSVIIPLVINVRFTRFGAIMERNSATAAQGTRVFITYFRESQNSTGESGLSLI